MEELLKCGTNIPLWHYDGEGQLLKTNEEHLVLHKILDFIGGTGYMLEYGKKSDRPLVLGSDLGLMWCAVFFRDKGALQSIYLLGPVLSGEVPSQLLEESVERYHIDQAFRRQYRKLLHGISVVPGILFFQYALMLHYCVTGEKLTRADIQFQPRSEIISPRKEEPENRDRRLPLYHTEQILLQMLREGDLNYRQAMADAGHLFGQTVRGRGESLLHARTRATGFAALCIREAITAGISPDTAHALGERYIENMLQCRSAGELVSVNLAMYEDFVFRVHRHRANPRLSPQIQSCREYIELHAEEELQLERLAKHVGYSSYYLSRKFKEEMGVSISRYIKYVRVERSRLLLLSTGVPVAQIAATLHFASSSHFSQAFRAVTGKTPQQYRQENSRY